MLTGTDSSLTFSPSRSLKPEVPLLDVLQKATVLLPHQAILENFVHTNPLAVLQDMDFFEAQEHVRGVLGYPSPGARLSSLVGSDPRKRAHAALIELAAVFLDRGAAKWSAPYRAKGFLYFFAELEAAVLFPSAWRAHARTAARRILRKLGNVTDDLAADSLAEVLLRESLEALETPAAEMQSTLTAMLFEVQGYASMFHRMEHNPSEAPMLPSGIARVRLIDFAAVHLILQRASIQALASEAVRLETPPMLEPTIACRLTKTENVGRCVCVQGWKKGTSLKSFLDACPEPDDSGEEEEQQNPSALAFMNQNMAKMHEIEQEYERVTLSAIARNTSAKMAVLQECLGPLLSLMPVLHLIPLLPLMGLLHPMNQLYRSIYRPCQCRVQTHTYHTYAAGPDLTPVFSASVYLY